MHRAITFVSGVVAGLSIALTATGLLVWADHGPQPVAGADAIASQFDLKVVWYSDAPSVPCGEQAFGCYTAKTPNVVYVKLGLNTPTTRSVILHEAAHAMQHRLGIPYSECAADAFAASMGAQVHFYKCVSPPLVSAP